jgi:hypothetical protein
MSALASSSPLNNAWNLVVSKVRQKGVDGLGEAKDLVPPGLFRDAINLKLEGGRTLLAELILHLPDDSKLVEAIDSLLKGGAEVEDALRLAMEVNKIGAFSALLESGASLDRKYDGNFSIVDLTRSLPGREEMLELLAQTSAADPVPLEEPKNERLAEEAPAPKKEPPLNSPSEAMKYGLIATAVLGTFVLLGWAMSRNK